MFALYADEEMTQADTPIKLTFNLLGNKSQDIVRYFGSPYASDSLKPTDENEIILTPVSTLKPFRPNSRYGRRQICEPTTPDGFMYECTVAGAVAEEPDWPHATGELAFTGNATFKCLGERFSTAAIQLSLTAAGLDTAEAGAPLTLGTELKGGAAIAVFIRVTLMDKTIRSDFNDPTLCLALNECIETHIA